MRTLLCLLSDQHVPNLLSVHHFQPDRLVLVESQQMQQRKVGDHFLQALALGGQDYGGDRQERQPLDHEDSLPAVRKALQAAFGRHPSDEWIVNVTGGTKPMSIETYQFFTALGGTLVYINLSEPDRIQWMDGSKVETCGHRLSIAEFLAGYGFTSRKPPAEVAEGEARASSWRDLTRALAAEAGPGELLVFETDEQRDKAWDRGLTLEPGHLRSPLVDLPAIRSRLAEAFGMAESPGGLAGKLDKYQVNFLLGQWLEVFVWGLLERNQEALGIWDVGGTSSTRSRRSPDSSGPCGFRSRPRRTTCWTRTARSRKATTIVPRLMAARSSPVTRSDSSPRVTTRSCCSRP